MGTICLLCSEGRTTTFPQTGHAWDMAYRQRGYGLSQSTEEELQPAGILPFHLSPMSGNCCEVCCLLFLD